MYIYIYAYTHIYIYISHILCIIICHISSWCFYFWPCDWSSNGSEGLLCMIPISNGLYTKFSMSECAMTATLLPRFGGLKNVVVNVHQEPSTARFRGVANWSAEKNGGILWNSVQRFWPIPRSSHVFVDKPWKAATLMGTMGIDPVLAVTRVFWCGCLWNRVFLITNQKHFF